MTKKTSIAARGQQLVAFAKELQRSGFNWLQAQNALYGPGGKYQELFSTPQDRTAFSGSVADKELNLLLESLPEPESQSPAREASGKLLVRMPKSVHQALIAEAEDEEVSLNQLILSKLSLQLRAVAH